MFSPATFEHALSESMDEFVSFRAIPLDTIIDEFSSTDIDCYCNCEKEDLEPHSRDCWRLMFAMMTNGDDQLDEVLENVEAEGFRSYIGVEEECGQYVVVNGHHRLAALFLLGYRYVPCVITKVDNPEWKDCAVNSQFVSDIDPEAHIFGVSFCVSENIVLTSPTVDKNNYFVGV